MSNDHKIDLKFVIRDCGGDMEAAQRRVDKVLEQLAAVTKERDEWKAKFEYMAEVHESQRHLIATEKELADKAIEQTTKMREQVKHWKEARQSALDAGEIMKAEIQSLREQVKQLKYDTDQMKLNRVTNLEAERDELRAEVERLKAAHTHISAVDMRAIGDIILERDRLKSQRDQLAQGLLKLREGHDPEITLDTRQCLEIMDAALKCL